MPIKKVWPSCRSTNLAIKVRVRSFGSCRLSKKKKTPTKSSENSTATCPSQRQAFARQFMVFVPGICCSAVVVRIYSLKAKKSPICKLSLVHRATALRRTATFPGRRRSWKYSKLSSRAQLSLEASSFLSSSYWCHYR